MHRVIGLSCCLLLAVLSSFAVSVKLPNDVHQMYQKRQNVLSLSSFQWNDCGSKTDPGHVTKISLTPDPLKLPGNVSLGFEATLGVDLSAPVELDVSVEKKVVVWIKIPCVHDIGSCNYPDVCVLLEQIDCPEIFQKHGIPCSCPVDHKTYSLPPSIFFVDDSSIPSVLANGDYKVTAKMSQNNKSVGCLSLAFSITR